MGFLAKNGSYVEKDYHDPVRGGRDSFSLLLSFQAFPLLLFTIYLLFQ